MSVFIGALMDLSRSMKDSIGDGVDEQGGTWSHSIFRVIDDLVQYDVSESNRVFVVGVGAKCSNNIFDIITTVMDCKAQDGDTEIPLSYLYEPASLQSIEDIFNILEQNGAHLIRRWANVDIVSSAVSEYLARIVIRKLRTDEQFTKKFVTEYLPIACRKVPEGFGNNWLTQIQSTFTDVVTYVKQASKEDIENVLANALLKPISGSSIYTVKEVSNALHGRIDERNITTERVRELLQIVEPFIYGGTPLLTALKEAEVLFNWINLRNEKYRKLLFILSDGEPTDDGIFDILLDSTLRTVKPKLERENVVIVCCFISKSSKIEPKKLHSVPESYWDRQAQFMFRWSSFIPTSSITRAIFIKNKWKIDITNNETRLFMHVNHPDNLKDVCNLARNAVCFQDSLSELLVSVSLDIYINDKNSSVKVYDQEGGATCYAHASATVVHLALHRILGRNQGYPTFEALRDEMINKYGTDGSNTCHVLKDICPKYRLGCQEVDVHGALKAITEKRPVVAGFWLTKQEWAKFNDFFKRTPDGILTKRDLDLSKRSRYELPNGHTVVLTSFNSKCLHLMNSWGDGWGDKGFFKVENAGVLEMKFIDVFWNESDLTPSEKASYRQHGAEVANTLMRSLKALQVASFICPECKRESNVDEFSGTLTRVYCPKCRREFSSSDGKGNLLALNIYLTTLSR